MENHQIFFGYASLILLIHIVIMIISIRYEDFLKKYNVWVVYPRHPILFMFVGGAILLLQCISTLIFLGILL